MTILLYIVAIIVGLIVFIAIIFGALLLNLYIANKRQEKKADKYLEPIYNSIGEGKPDTDSITQCANDPCRRVHVYTLLVQLGRLDLFPAEFVNQQSIAESQLVNWLEHPNELKNPPDEIELVKIVTLPGEEPVGPINYYLFKFRTFEPHWAAHEGWMAGVAGPYPARSNDIHVFPGGTFSELDAFDSKTPEEHVKFLHGKMLVRKLKIQDAIGQVPKKEVTL